MKTLLVTSEVTYIPNNYQELFEEVLVHAKPHIAGFVIIKNLDFNLLKTTAGLFYLGAHNIGKSLIKNIMQLKLKKRENVFSNVAIPTYVIDNINSQETIDLVKKLDIDLIVNLRTRSIYKSAILDAPKLGCLNIHHGILPNYRGTLCDLYALSEGRAAGFTIHRMNKKIDDGEILLTQNVDDGQEKNYINYLAKTARVEGLALGKLINQIARENAIPSGIKNIPSKKVYTRNPSRKQIKSFIQQEMVL